MTMYVITHKEFDYPISKSYVPLLVGANKNKNPRGYLADNTGENISNKNPNYSELTGLYWLWKNQSDRNIGISHYRRYFSKCTSNSMLYYRTLLSGAPIPINVSRLDNYLKAYDWVVPTPETVEEGSMEKHFIHCHNEKDLIVTRKVIEELYPEYISSFDNFMHGDKASFLNMFYTSKDQMDNYCEWLFKILFEVEKRVDITDYDPYQKRLFGFLSERLFNVWLEYNQPNIKYLATFNTDLIDRGWAARQIKHKVLRWN
ncbi:DUF4422 domain-containing protein [Weissella confusa]|uniref:Polyhydroxyalkanoate synthase n=1 Tax=Limosilactobacillus reuteri TaxID=1598 RepID=A0A2T5Q3W3_LIMRT|nr:DUF4422 domain-containing protein [Limosilactobacillus reuteri]MCW3763738.1 DUF4422 domain-containing protein [Weissella confusa]PTV04116.1 polyhydroxyalkanoate synthase [Limosilactobacillus reuteri]